ncbi:hypothetical protein JTB14_014595 [Gonioctena quinquepunctata]|nr:hypothetical protein JTB14_014595 [Gonioctena quinquepunctata]
MTYPEKLSVLSKSAVDIKRELANNHWQVWLGPKAGHVTVILKNFSQNIYAVIILNISDLFLFEYGFQNELLI